MKLREDDVWVLSFPRSGTTVTQELVWMVNNGLDFEKGKAPLFERNIFLDMHISFGDEFLEELYRLNEGKADFIAERTKTPGYVLAESWPSPRQFKAHIPLSLLPPGLVDKCKVIYIARNPKDVAVSYFHHNRLFRVFGFSKDFPQYWEYFENNLLRFSPFWDHILEAWKLKDHPNMLFLFYENLITDMPGTIKRVADFLNKPMTPEQIEQLRSHLDIENFKKLNINGEQTLEGITKPDEQQFIRRGKIGGNKEFTQELNSRAQKWMDKHLKLTDLRFPGGNQ